MACDFWLDVAKTVLGTFVGAGLAFAANLYAQCLQRRRADLTAGNVAMAMISQQLGDFRHVARGVKQELEERAALPEWLRIRPLTMIFDKDLKFDFEKLGFLVPLGAPLLGELALSQRRYLALAFTVEEHNSNARAIQRRLAEAGIVTVTEETSAIRSAVGHDLIGQQTSLTGLLLEFCEKEERTYLDLACKLHDKLREIFGYRFYWQKVVIIGIDPHNPLT
jgi:hypothetical protein